jgi:hypothetical protein
MEHGRVVELPCAARTALVIRKLGLHRLQGHYLDFKLRCNNWGFLLSDVKQNVYMQHSRTDNFPPVEITAELLPNCRLEIRESGEHFSSALLDSFIKTTVLPKMEK